MNANAFNYLSSKYSQGEWQTEAGIFKSLILLIMS